MPGGAQPQCTQTSDCNTAAGEVCDQGACWGGPPAGQFAAIVVPPSTAPDLIYTEIAAQALPADGALANVPFETAVTLSGRVEAYCPDPINCADTSLAATVTVTRPSRFTGGPSFTAVASSKGGLARGADSFAIAVPPTDTGDVAFTISIDPESSGDAPPTNGTASPAELAPPARLMQSAANDTEVGTITLGAMDSIVLTGTLTDTGGKALTKYRVVALGRFDPASPQTEVSTVDFTTDGTYAITLADGIAGTVTIEASPYDPSVTAPTLYLAGVATQSGAHVLVQPDYLGNLLAVAIPIRGLAGDGSVVPVAGAHVTVVGTYVAIDNPLVHATLEADAQTADDGTAQVTLLDGAAFSGAYELRVIPPAGSQLGVYDAAFDTTAATTPVRLPARLALTGTVVDASGAGVPGISVTASPSLHFVWNLDADGQALLAQIPAPTAITDNAGDFAVWVDPLVAQVWGYYDLDFTVPATVAAASWTDSEIEIPRQADQTILALGRQPLPPTAFMHGQIVDPNAVPVAGGELRVFQIETDTSLCTMVQSPPDNCVIPAQEIGHGTSGTDGTVRLALPRDPAAP